MTGKSSHFTFGTNGRDTWEGAHPQKYDAMIREAGPVVYSQQYGVWATGRHAQIEMMMRDWRTFSSTKPPFEEIGQPMILLSDDPPDHQRVRTVISKGMSPAVLRTMQEAFEAEAENTVRRLLDAPDGLIDGHTELAKAYVLKVFPDAIGPAQRSRAVRRALAEVWGSKGGGTPWGNRRLAATVAPSS